MKYKNARIGTRVVAVIDGRYVTVTKLFSDSIDKQGNRFVIDPEAKVSKAGNFR